MHRIIAVLLSAALCLMVPLYPNDQAYAAGASYTDEAGNTWTYTVTGGEVTISKCRLGSSSDVIVPATIEGLPVTAIAGDSGDLFYAAYLNSLTFPSTITSFVEEGYGMFFDSAVDGDGIYFLGPCPTDIDWATLCMMDPYTAFHATPEHYADWDASLSAMDYYDSTLSEYAPPTSVAIRQSGADTSTATVAAGGTLTLSAVNLPESAAYKSYHTALVWTSSNAEVFVDNRGVVSADASVPAGTKAIVTAKNALGLSDSIEVTVEAAAAGKTDIATGCVFDPARIDDVYVNAGAPAIPSVVVKNAQTNNVLAEGADYDVSYETAAGVALAAAPTSVGSYRMVLTGKGASYEGAHKIAFSIVDELSLDGWLYRPNADGQTAELCGYAGAEASAIVVPAYLADYRVTSVATGALSGSAASTIVVPDTVKQVAAGAFSEAGAATIRFLGEVPTFADAAATFAGGASVECFGEQKASFDQALAGIVPVAQTSGLWSYYLSIAADGTRTGTLGATGSLYAFHGSSDPELDMTLPDQIDGVALSVLGDYALYGDFDYFDFSVVRVPATYAQVADFAFLDLDAVVVFEGACPEKIGDYGAGTGNAETELWYPVSEEASWSACTWTAANGSYDDDWVATVRNGSPVLIGYRGAGGTIELPSMFYGHVLASASNVNGDATAATSIRIPTSITDIEGTLFHDVTSDVEFLAGPPAASDAAAVVTGADGGAYTGTLWYPASWEPEWLASDYAKHYALKPLITCNPADYTYEQTADGLVVTGYTGSVPDIEIPSAVDVEIDGVRYAGTVVGIGENAFSQRGLTGVSIPGTVKSVGREAFWHCGKLRMVKLAEGVQSIGMNAFWYCDSLARIDLPASLVELGQHPFVSSTLEQINVAPGCATFSSVDGVLFNADKTQLVCYPMGRTKTTYTVPATVETIGAGAFRGEYDDSGNALSEVILPDGLKKIEWAAFRNAEGLTRVIIPDSVTELGTYLFDSCGKLAEVKFPAGCTEIPEGILAFDSAVTSVEIPEGVRRIGANAFQLTSITTLALPEGLEEIGDSAFDGCGELVSVGLPSTLVVVEDNAFTGCDSVVELDLTKTAIHTIGHGAFAGMKALKSIVVPHTVTSFGRAVFSSDYSLSDVTFEAPCQLTELPSQTFAWCPIKTITLPAGISYIDDMAFYQCTELTDIVFLNKGSWSAHPNSFLYAAPTFNAYGYVSSSTQAVMVGCTFCPIDVTMVSDVPQLVEAKVGDTVTLRVVAVAQYGDLAYQWYRDGVAIEGATGESYQFVPLAEGMQTYSVEVKNAMDPESPLSSTGAVRVSAAELDLADAVQVSAIPDQAYTSFEVTPEVSVRTTSGAVLAEGIDYRVEYRNNVEPGTAFAIVIGVGGYKGQIEVPFAIVAGSADFADVVSDAWYAPSVQLAARLGIIEGHRDASGNLTGFFGPEDDVTRGQIAVMFARCAHVDLSAYEGVRVPFADVDQDAYYATAIAWALEQGIMKGDEGLSVPTMRPDDPATRQEVAAMTARLAAACGVDVSGASSAAFFQATDWRLVDAWAVPSLIWTADAGIMAGKDMPDGTKLLDPQGTTTRAEMAKIVVAMTTEIIR